MDNVTFIENNNFSEELNVYFLDALRIRREDEKFSQTFIENSSQLKELSLACENLDVLKKLNSVILHKKNLSKKNKMGM